MYGNLWNIINQSLYAYHNYYSKNHKGFEFQDINYINKLTNEIIKKIEKNIDKQL